MPAEASGTEPLCCLQLMFYACSLARPEQVFEREIFSCPRAPPQLPRLLAVPSHLPPAVGQGETAWGQRGQKGLGTPPCTWNNSEASWPPVPWYPSPRAVPSPLRLPLGPLGTLPAGACGSVRPSAVSANNSEEELALAGATNPGQPGSPPTAQKQLKVAHRGHCKE